MRIATPPMFDYRPPPGPRRPDWGAPVEGSPWMRAPERTEPTRSSPRRFGAATELAIVAVTAHDYGVGVRLEIEGRRAPGARPELVLGSADADEGEDFEPPAQLREEFLRFGVADATGAVATNLPGARWTPRFDAAPSGTVLAGGTSDSTPAALTSRWWLWPAPHGELEVACEWPAFGVAETRARLNMRDLTWHGSQPSASLARAWKSHADPRRWVPGPALAESTRPTSSPPRSGAPATTLGRPRSSSPRGWESTSDTCARWRPLKSSSTRKLSPASAMS